MQERHRSLPPCCQHRNQRRRRKDDRSATRPRLRVDVRGGGPPQEPLAEHEERGTAVDDEHAVGEGLERGLMAPLTAGRPVHPLDMEPRVDCVRPALVAWMELAPECDKASVVLVSAERTGTMARGEGGRLVEEEQLGESPRLQKARPSPATKLEPAPDPTPTVEAPPNVAVPVVQAATIAVDEPSRRVGDELAERRHPVPERHGRHRTGEAAGFSHTANAGCGVMPAEV